MESNKDDEKLNRIILGYTKRSDGLPGAQSQNCRLLELSPALLNEIESTEFDG